MSMEMLKAFSMHLLQHGTWQCMIHQIEPSCDGLNETHYKYLARDCDLIMPLVANRAAFLVCIVEDNGHSCFGDTCLTLFVD